MPIGIVCSLIVILPGFTIGVDAGAVPVTPEIDPAVTPAGYGKIKLTPKEGVKLVGELLIVTLTITPFPPVTSVADWNKVPETSPLPKVTVVDTGWVHTTLHFFTRIQAVAILVMKPVVTSEGKTVYVRVKDWLEPGEICTQGMTWTPRLLSQIWIGPQIGAVPVLKIV